MGKMAFRKFLCRVFEGFVKFFCCFKRVLGPMQIGRPPKPDEVEPTKKDQTSEVSNMCQRIVQTNEDASSMLANMKSKIAHLELRDIQDHSSPLDCIRLMRDE